MSSGNSTSNAAPNEPDDNRGPVVLAVTLWMLGFSTVFIVLRCISRLGIVKRWSWDDTFIIIAWFLAFGFSFSICWGVRSGLGLHQEYVPASTQLDLRKSEYLFSVLYNPVLMATKTSILLFYLTLAKNQQFFRWATIATLVVVNVAGLALTLLNVFQCRPMYTLFWPTIPSFAVCIDLVTIYLSSSPVNVVTDLTMLVLPFPALTMMRLPRKQKIILIITFSFGFFVAAVDIVRIAYLQEAFEVRLKEVGQQNAATSKALTQDDFSWYASLSFMWSAVEVHVGMICACVPSLKPLVARILPSLLRDMSNPHDTSHFRQDSGINALDFASSKPEHSPPQSPARAHFSDGQGDGSIQTSSPVSHRFPQLESSPNGHAGGPDRARDDENVDFMEFLTTPDMTSPRNLQRPPTLGTATTASTTAMQRRGSVPFFDFYNMKRKKPMTKLDNTQAFAPLVAVTMLFFLWGFAYGLLDVLNSKFAQVNNLNINQTLGPHAAYFSGYAFGPLTIGRVVFLKLGFRATFITGLSIYAFGTLIFWPSAVLSSYPVFIICNFIVGFGVAILEVAANPFIALCGPPQHAEIRLNISQGIQAIGTVVAPLLATKVFFASVNDGGGFIDVQWAYLGIAFFDVALAVIFYYLPIPEGTDEDFEKVAEKRQSVNDALIFGKAKVIYVTLALGVFSQFCYLGAQEGTSEAYQSYITVIYPSSPIDAFSWQTVGHTTFAVGRFLSAAAQFFFRPRTVLLGLFVGMIITSALLMALKDSAGAGVLSLYELFQSGVFPMIYAISLRGLGSYTKRGAVLITAATSGGAIFPVVMSPIARTYGVPYSMCVVVACASFGAIFPLYLTLVPEARKQVDPVVLRKRNIAEGSEGEHSKVRHWLEMIRSPNTQTAFGDFERGGNENEIENDAP